MSVGILVITHDTIGSSLLETTTSMLGVCTLPTRNLPIAKDCDPDAQLTEALHLIEELDQGDGILILTDMFGSTPSNIASRLLTTPNRVVITGLNLPMLVRVMNYPDLMLDALVDKAISGGQDGVFHFESPIEY